MGAKVSFKKGLSENITTAGVFPGQILVATDNGQVRVDYSITEDTSSSVFVSDPSKVASMTYNVNTRKLTYIKGNGASTDIILPIGVYAITKAALSTNTAYIAYIDGITLTHGTVIFVRFTLDGGGSNGANATLNISNDNGTSFLGEKPIYYKNAAVKAGVISSHDTVALVYDTSKVTTGAWRIIGACGTATETSDGLMSAADKTKLDNIGFGVTGGTASAYTATVAGATLTPGTMLALRFNVANNANATLNLNSLGDKPIYYKDAAITAGKAPANAVLLLLYDTSQVSTGAWHCIYSYDSNSTYSNASLGQGYGTCTTAADTTAKIVTLSNYALTLGGIVAVKFTNAVPANATMNINSKGAKAIYYRGSAIVANIIKAGDTATFIYDGTRYHLIGRGSIAYKPAGTVSQPTFSGSSLTSTGTFTPAGTVSVSTNGTTNKTALVTTTTGDSTYTPAGSVTVTPSVTAPTTTVNSITAVGTLPSCTLPTFSATVSDELLTFNWAAGSFSAGTLPTKGDNTTVVKSVSVNATGSFSGTGVRLITDNIPVPSTYTASFSGTPGTVTVSGTPAGTVSQPTFTGTESTMQLA